MPTIDDLAPATAASDSDELPVSQNGITRKITRAQILAGVQAQITMGAGTILGRTTAGSGSSEVIIVGKYLNLASGTLSAMAAPYSIVLCPGGLVPSPSDMVPIAQGGNNVSVTYSTFLKGLSAVATIDGTQLLVTPTGASTSIRMADLASSVIMKTGGSLSGTLSLASDPSAPLQAASKQYVDVKVNRAGDTLTGPLQLIGDPTSQLQAATKSYVDTNASLFRLGFTMAGPIILAADPTVALNPATKSYTDARLARSGDTMTGPLGLSTGPVSALQATTKSYVDAQVAMSLSLSGGTIVGPLTLSTDPSNLLQAATKQYADTKLARTGDTMSGPLTLAGVPTNSFHAATKAYIDSQFLAAVPKTGGTMSGPVLLSGDPTLPSQAATKYYVDLRLTESLPIAGGTMVGPITLTTGPAVPAQAANKQYVDTQLAGLLPLVGGSLSGLLTLASASPTAQLHATTKQYVDANPAAAVKLAAGQSIAFEPTNSVTLTYSGASGTIVAKYGAMTCAVGRGISVSSGIIFSATATIPATSAGCIVFLVGTGTYTITLPPANSVMAGTGFTFSAIGTGTVSVVPATADILDLAPVTLRQFDRYHIISDGSSLWREIFRTNSVSPRFTAPPILPSYSVIGLPASPGAGAKAFVTNGRKPGEVTGAGTGVEVFFDGTRWISVCSGVLITA